ncbi:TerC/Alx family metal homeostasis membrane protein [Actinocatenispora rupis]|uniref:Tellurium resistance protein TerC n=1 Tax=Actinocatenispora rupis TaxID=519421 RepID=A0A8J3NA60_9ACTN|nr:TerC/Alx family metal homeostasis membrane protein [Actinocatenispora rupis]GID09380.1 tellurium resistance protein TerC [Actinocatenispora rupis]
MVVHGWVWATTIVVLLAILLIDLAVIGRRPHVPSMRECTLWVVLYVGLAGLFGLGLYLLSGPKPATEFFAGWITEYSLSVDNLFVFVIIMSRFAVPRRYQQKVLLIGIVLALVMRGLFIAAGAAMIERFAWVFYVFGAFLVYTAVKTAVHKEGDEADEFKVNPLVRWARRRLPLSREFGEGRVLVREGGRRMVTPMLIVMITIGTTDLLFALDSIPAIFGLTKEAYLVFAANVFALMGLRQLYFLLGGLMERLVYLNVGLGVILGFIGVKLILEAMHENELPFVNGGQPITWAPHVPIWLSLSVIVAALAVTTAASLVKTSVQARRAAHAER